MVETPKQAAERRIRHLRDASSGFSMYGKTAAEIVEAITASDKQAGTMLVSRADIERVNLLVQGYAGPAPNRKYVQWRTEYQQEAAILLTRLAAQRD